MALTRLPWLHDKRMAHPPAITMDPQFITPLLDAAADRVLVGIGRFVHPSRGTVTVDGAGFLLGAVSKANGSTLKLTLQGVSLTVGATMREDGVIGQTLSIANADAGFATNLWYAGLFDASATRTLTHGDLVAAVVQFDTFVAGDTVRLRLLSTPATGLQSTQGGVVINVTGSYVPQAALPNVAFHCTDGTYGTIQDAFVCSALTDNQLNLNTAGADEYAIGVQYPVPCEVDGIWVAFGPTSTTQNTEILLYNGTTALATVNIDHNATLEQSTHSAVVPIPVQAFLKDTLYRVAVRPLGTSNISVYTFDVATAGHLTLHPGGTVAHLWTRVDQGAWGGEVTTRRLFAGLQPSAFDDGVSAGGGGIIIPRTIVR